MAKSSKDVSGGGHELKPEMRELLLSFDAKDRRKQTKDGDSKSKQRRRRGDKPAQAA